MRRAAKISAKLFVLVALVALVVYGYYTYRINTPISNDATIDQFTVEKGWGSTVISHKLREAGYIKSPMSFQLYTWTHGFSSKLQPGTYALSKSWDLKKIAAVLRQGPDGPREVSLTFIEGWRINDIATYVEEKEFGTRSEFLRLVQKKQPWWNEYDFLDDKPSTVDLEGYLFPDTYRVWSDASLEDIAQKMLSNFDARLTPAMRTEIQRQGKSIHEVVTMASILEREVRGAEDMKMVADIFYKRLAINMALQADSTVNYATGKSTPAASLEDLQVDSPYNTYKYPGLPPGPISNPGIAAITAAIYPTSNEFYYFLTTPEGEVIYSKTHDEHVAAKAKYLR